MEHKPKELTEDEYHLETCDEETQDCPIKLREAKKGNWLYQIDLE